jgi:phosphate transport system permease protein
VSRRISPRRRITDWVARGLAAVCVVIALIPLASILDTAAVRGGAVLRPSFLTSGEPLPCSPLSCSVGGIAPAIQGSFVLLALASLIAMPVGILAGIYLSEFGRHRVGRTASFLIDVLTGVPSIVIGVFAYTIFLLIDPAIVYSAIDGSIALAIIMLPVVVRTTEESLRLVPRSVREAALALGIPQHRATLRIVLPTGGGAVVTGAILAVARAGGEAAPLLFTAFGNRLGFVGLTQPTEALPPLIFNFGTSASRNWVADAWGAALVLILAMLAMSLTARFILHRRTVMIAGGG